MSEPIGGLQFGVHGTPLEVACRDVTLAGDARALLGRFAAPGRPGASRLELRAAGRVDPPGPDAALLAEGDDAGGWRGRGSSSATAVAA